MERVDTPVFISYARRTARPYAEKLYEALGGAGGFAFLDTAEIEAGEHFPSALGEAVLRSRVVLAFLDETYFNRWYCLRELQLSLSPFDALWRRGSVSDADKERALAHIVLALPAAGCALQAMDNLPPVLRNTDWPPASDTHRLAELVRGRLERCPDTIAERCRQRGVGTSRLASLLEEAALPTPRNLSGVPLFPPEIAPSLGAAFVGRADDLWRIHFILSTFRGEAATAAALSGALEGTAGSGKTQLAIEYVWRFGPPCYTGGIFWIDADVSEERLTERFHGIMQKLDATTPDLAVFLESGRSASRELARALQNLPPSLPVLFVVDNVPEPKPGTAPRPLSTWCPVLGRVTVLATSRFRLSLDARVQALPVQPLAPAGAVNLLTRDVMRSRLDDGSWGCIAEWVGNLPLALTVLNRAIVAGVLDPRELVRNVELAQPTEVIDRQAELLRDQVPEGMLRGVTEALSLSYERLSDLSSWRFACLPSWRRSRSPSTCSMPSAMCSHPRSGVPSRLDPSSRRSKVVACASSDRCIGSSRTSRGPGRPIKEPSWIGPPRLSYRRCRVTPSAVQQSGRA